MKKVFFKETITTIALLLAFSACKKKETAPAPEEPQPFKQEAANVLNDGSGYSSIYDYIENIQGVGSAIGHLDLNAFTVESNGTLNFVRNSGYQSQQSYLVTNTRASVDLSTKAEIALPAYTGYFTSHINTDNVNKAADVLYLPYTNKATYRTNGLNYSGDFSSLLPETANSGSIDADLCFVQANLGKVITTVPSSAQTVIMRGLQNPPNASLTGGTAQSYTFSNPAGGNVILCGMFDWRRTTAPVNTHGFILRNDSMIVYNCNTSTLAKITGVSVAGLNTGNTLTSFRNYSADGNTMGIVFKESTSNHYWTYSYNVTTQVLSKGLEDAVLDYAQAGSDIDADEFGNLYYSGVAGNGSNAAGVSIYKKSAGGGTTLAGSDNFLKFGTVKDLKCMFGKVYLVVAGTISGTYYGQLSFLKLN